MTDTNSDTGSTRCGNCQSELAGPYCHQCGQPIKGLIRPLSGWFADFLDGVLQWDGRIPRTLTPLLLRPGFLTREYIAGRRVRYVTPVRLFLFLVIVLFLAVNWIADLGGMNGVDVGPAQEDHARIERIVAWLPAAERHAVLRSALSPPPAESTGAVNFSWDEGPRNPVQLSWLSDSMNAQLDDAVERMSENIQRANRDPQAFVEQLLAVAPQVLIVMLPLFALLLKLFYLLRRRLYMEHLLVALHSHAFIALALLLIVLLDTLAGVTPWAWLATALGWLIIALWVWIPVNLLLTQKRVYAQGWFLTGLKFTLIGSLYTVLLVAVTVATVMLSLLLW